MHDLHKIRKIILEISLNVCFLELPKEFPRDSKIISNQAL